VQTRTLTGSVLIGNRYFMIRIWYQTLSPAGLIVNGNDNDNDNDNDDAMSQTASQKERPHNGAAFTVVRKLEQSKAGQWSDRLTRANQFLAFTFEHCN
jgi:hypothetical protein